MGWVITISKDVDWGTYEKQLATVSDFSQSLYYRVEGFPNAMKLGDDLFITYKGVIRGYQKIVALSRMDKWFFCPTTCKQYQPGYYIERSGPFHKIEHTVYPAFRGIRPFQLMSQGDK